jgi:hypothetical protein
VALVERVTLFLYYQELRVGQAVVAQVALAQGQEALALPVKAPMAVPLVVAVLLAVMAVVVAAAGAVPDNPVRERFVATSVAKAETVRQAVLAVARCHTQVAVVVEQLAALAMEALLTIMVVAVVAVVVQMPIKQVKFD